MGLLDGKNAIIYGGGGSIGSAIARAFAREGCAVYLAGRTAASLQVLADDIQAGGGQAHPAVVDALDETAVQALGKDPARVKVQVFMLGAGLAGLAGAFYAHVITYISPDQFLPLVTFYVWIAIIIGGPGRTSGAVIGSLILLVFLEGSRFARDFVPGVSEVQMASVRLALVGLSVDARHAVHVA